MNHFSFFHLSEGKRTNDTNRPSLLVSLLPINRHLYHSFTLVTCNPNHRNHRFLKKTSETIVTNQSSSQRSIYPGKTSETIVTNQSTRQQTVFASQTFETIVTNQSSSQQSEISDDESTTIKKILIFFIVKTKILPLYSLFHPLLCYT
jgi:hypothetical protein